MKVGFLGTGVMGSAMAGRLLDAGMDLVVWNRTAAKVHDLAARGAVVGGTPAEVIATCPTTLLMLADDRVTDEVLGRSTSAFPALVAGRCLVNTGTVPPAYSAGLAADVTRHGGTYVEAPVSGSRRPAEDGTLVVMLAGDDDALSALEPLLAPLSTRQVRCGVVPQALLTKLAVNIHLITLVTGLAEAFHFAGRHGLDLATVAAVMAAGPMTSQVSRMKADKLLAGDLSPQASVRDVLYNCRVIAHQAREAAVSAPLLDTCEQLFAQAERLGSGAEDMIGVIRALGSYRTDTPLPAGQG
jgi:3-hydroxyisobutyrate dehydrogenase